MWRNPLIVFQSQKGFSMHIFEYLRATEFEKNPCLSDEKLLDFLFEGDREYAARIRASYVRAATLLKELRAEYIRIKASSLSGDERDVAILNFIVKQSLMTAKLIEGAGSYRLVSDLHVMVYYLRTVFFDSNSREFDEGLMQEHYFDHAAINQVLLDMYTTSIHLLVGNESKLLIGTRGDLPAWKTMDPPMTNNDDLPAILMACQMPMIGQEDAEFFPDPRTVISELMSEDLPQFEGEIDYRYMLDTLEDAFRSMRYLFPPDGVRVEIHDFAPITAVRLKIKPSMYKPDSFGVIAVFETTKGNVIHVGDCIEEVCQTIVEDPTAIERTSRVIDFYYFVITQIYHDLVTAKEIELKPRSTSKIKQLAKPETKLPLTPKKQLGKPTFGFTLIPRAYREHEPVDPRIPCQPPLRHYEPHLVSGHIRRANMSERQRRAIQELEEETGIRILRYVPDGFTIVKPHCSPQDSIKIKDLPTYIKLRMEDDLRKSFQKRQKELAGQTI